MNGLYQQILLSLQKVLADPVRPLCSHYGAVVGLHALGWKVRTCLSPSHDVMCVAVGNCVVSGAVALLGVIVSSADRPVFRVIPQQ